MNRVLSLLLLLIVCTCHYAQANSTLLVRTDTTAACDSLLTSDTLSPLLISDNPDALILAYHDSVLHTKFRAKKIIASILSFPLPFGLLGLHRLFLGTKPYMPFVYMGTIGGCFLILPMIDFIAILAADEETFKHFENNPKVFMWSH